MINLKQFFKQKNIQTDTLIKNGNIIDYITTDVINDWLMFKSPKPTFLIQGCNCRKAMAGGIARIIALKFKGAKLADDMYNTPTPTEYSKYELRPNKWIINAYTQANPGGINKGMFIGNKFYSDSKSARLSYIKGSLERIKNDFSEGVLFFPQLGAGIAGGDWSEIRSVIIDVFKNTNFTIKLSYFDKSWTIEEFQDFVNNNN